MPEPTPKDTKWMQFCVEGARIFSTCERRQYFAIVLDQHGHVLGTGYNGVPPGFVHCDEGGCPRALSDSPPGSSYNNCYALHAESNALLHSDYSSRHNGTVIVNGPPCFDCAKLLANVGIKKLVYLPDASYPEWPKVEEFFDMAGIALVPIQKDEL